MAETFRVTWDTVAWPGEARGQDAHPVLALVCPTTFWAILPAQKWGLWTSCCLSLFRLWNA